MAKYKSYTETVEIDIGLEEWDDSELIEELQARGYKVEEEPDFIEVAWRLRRGDVKEALILLERKVPELIGIAKIAD
jgi:hypothetical protein